MRAAHTPPHHVRPPSPTALHYRSSYTADCLLPRLQHPFPHRSIRKPRMMIPFPRIPFSSFTTTRKLVTLCITRFECLSYRIWKDLKFYDWMRLDTWGLHMDILSVVYVHFEFSGYSGAVYSQLLEACLTARGGVVAESSEKTKSLFPQHSFLEIDVVRGKLSLFPSSSRTCLLYWTCVSSMLGTCQQSDLYSSGSVASDDAEFDRKFPCSLVDGERSKRWIYSIAVWVLEPRYV